LSQIEIKPIGSSQYAEARSICVDRQSIQIKMIGMPRYTSLNITHRMKISKYLSAIVSIGAIWCLLDITSPARGFSVELPLAKPSSTKSLLQIDRAVAQNSQVTPATTEIDKDLRLQGISITRNSEDNSLLTFTGSINNRSDQTHYVYYIVAKFVANDTSIKQAIIPVNVDIKPGQSQTFTHEISTESVNSIVPEQIKPVVVKYEYR
jgi:hypothetical protein